MSSRLKKKVVGIALIWVLISTVSATDLSYATVFPECVPGSDGLRCAAYVFVPNLHLNALWNLLVQGTIDSIYSVGNNIVSTIFDTSIMDAFFTEDLNSVDWVSVFSGFVLHIAAICALPLTAGLIALPTFVLGVVSSVVVYIILITIEFLKSYLFLSVAWLLWDRALLKRDDPLPIEGRTLAGVMMLVMVAGSIILINMDFNILAVV